MSWCKVGYNTHKLPSIDSYAEAKARYEKTKPIRGRAEDVRPLGKRSSTHMQIKKIGDNYALALYNSNCVMWYPPMVDNITNKTEERLGVSVGNYYPTVSTADFLDNVLPLGLRASMQNNVIRVQGCPVPQHVGEQKNWLHFTNTGNAGWVAQNRTPEYVHRVNRKAANDVRKRHAAFTDWATSYLSLRENKIPVNEVAHIKVTMDDFKVWFKAAISSDDYEQYVNAILRLAVRKGRRNWHSETWTVTMEDVMHWLLRVHADEVLVREELPHGVVKRDPYGKWVK